MKRNAAAVWQGGLKDGQGTISSESGALQNVSYTFDSRFAAGTSTAPNPEELLAAAHAGCYSMALSQALGEEDITPERIDTTATVTMEPSDEGFTITAVHLEVQATLPGVDRSVFEAAANHAKVHCPVSRLFNAKITLDAQLRE